MKTCRTCNVSKPEAEFGRYKGRDKVLTRKECKTCRATAARKRYTDNPEVKTKMLAASNAYHYMKSYGLTKEEIAGMREKCGNACEICGTKVKLHIDHCHASGHVRGLLCPQCNKALGLFKDNVNSLKMAIKYLEERQ